MTLNLLFATITVSIKRNRKSLDQELDVIRRRGLIESNQYKQSFYIHH
ncbi:YrzI family small protein [Pseudalkalibacillus hwajinpoensis]|uniref:YrzI family small protein n=1 Tax=Guptibacillus hwajinpoensis TaxID=208199 RepID=A0A4U1MIM7_9BACL|nr:YrzI family small protein [Pseudalkalibacillus hwajinpoensis]TKD70220.1 YrzI family small protein [Pseudalkalibacillus hwajinpoensis]